MIQVCGWQTYQHYKRRNPPWVKLYRSLLSDHSLMRLPVASRWLAIGLLVIAAETDNKIPNDPDWLSWRLRLEADPDIAGLVSAGFITLSQDASTTLAGSRQNAPPETEGETETETEKSSVLSEPAEPSVENSKPTSKPDEEPWNDRLAPLARELGGEKHVGNWLRWAKSKDTDECERIMLGFKSMRERGAIWVKPGEPCTPAVLTCMRDGQPIENAAIAEYWRITGPAPATESAGPTRLQA